MAKLIRAKENLIIKKPENLVKARFKLSPLAIKFLSTIIANIKRGDNLDEEYVLQVKDFKELTGQKTKRIYELIEEALEDLLKNPLKIPLNEEQTKFLMCNWVSSAIYDAGQVSFLVDKRLRPLLLEIKEKFLKYRLENILNLRSGYSIRMYEILKDWLELNNRYGNKAEKIVSLAEFREILEIPRSYKYGMLKQRILNKAKTELEKHTDILFEYEEIKTGRKVTHLKFIIKPNPAKLQTYNRVQENYFSSRKNFVALLRKNYSGNGKFWGFKTIDKKSYWLGLDNEGLVYATSGKDIKDFNGVESAEIYEFWLKVAQNSELYKELISEGICLKDLALNNKELWLEFREDLIRLKEEGII
jgi:plasmid replication initiation protein